MCITEADYKEIIVDIGKRMYERGFVSANDGNISIRIGKCILTTPTGVSKGYMKPDMIVKTDLYGNVLEGSLKPSSEMKMHLRVYSENPNVKCVCHAHPPVSTSFAVCGKSLNEPILAEAVLNLKEVPCVAYGELGSDEIPELISPYINSHRALLLGNHGVITWGEEPYRTYYLLESVEQFAKVTMLSGMIGDTKKLTETEVNRLLVLGGF